MYAIEVITQITQDEYRAQARADVLARQAQPGAGRPGFIGSIVAAVRNAVGGVSEGQTFVPKMADYPSPH